MRFFVSSYEEMAVILSWDFTSYEVSILNIVEKCVTTQPKCIMFDISLNLSLYHDDAYLIDGKSALRTKQHVSNETVDFNILKTTTFVFQ